VYCAGFITNTHFLTQQKYHEKILSGFFCGGRGLNYQMQKIFLLKLSFCTMRTGRFFGVFKYTSKYSFSHDCFSSV